MIEFKPATCIGDVYAEGDEIICMQHLHKQWARTCNGLSESRLERIDAARALAGAEAREDIVKQATREHVSRRTRCARRVSSPVGRRQNRSARFIDLLVKRRRGTDRGTGSGTRSGHLAVGFCHRRTNQEAAFEARPHHDRDE